MKKILSLLLLLSVFLAALCSCEHSEISITYFYRNGEEAKSVTVAPDELEPPSAPEREGYVFLGWSTSPDTVELYDFSASGGNSVALYAVWMPNYEKLSERVTNEAMRANVKIYTEHYSNGIIPSATSQGSGVIFYDSGSHYYILTNHHVLVKSGEFFYTDYTVYDAFGNEYIAEYIESSSEYDLGVLRVRKKAGADDLLALDLSLSIPTASDAVISLGSPKGQMNSVTFGTVSSYKPVSGSSNSSVENEVKFDVIWHTSFANHGSSGGALLNTSLDIVGINFAVATNENGEFLHCVAIPTEKIIEYLDKCNLKYNLSLK